MKMMISSRKRTSQRKKGLGVSRVVALKAGEKVEKVSNRRGIVNKNKAAKAKKGINSFFIFNTRFRM
jgi:hypothetical protein